MVLDLGQVKSSENVIWSHLTEQNKNDQEKKKRNQLTIRSTGLRHFVKITSQWHFLYTPTILEQSWESKVKYIVDTLHMLVTGLTLSGAGKRETTSESPAYLTNKKKEKTLV